MMQKNMIFSRCFHGLGHRIQVRKYRKMMFFLHNFASTWWYVHKTTGFILLKPRPTKRTFSVVNGHVEAGKSHTGCGPPPSKPVLPDFSRFPAGSDDCLNAFFTDPRHGRYCGRYVPGAYDLCARLLFAIELETS